MKTGLQNEPTYVTLNETLLPLQVGKMEHISDTEFKTRSKLQCAPHEFHLILMNLDLHTHTATF